DYANRPITVTAAISQQVTFAYFPNGQKATQTDAYVAAYGQAPTSRTARYGYDALNRPVALTDTLGLVTRTTYDARGNALTKTDPRGVVITSTYSLRDELANVTYPDVTHPDG